ncbi:MAG: histone H1 [Betaproteobacteria bacterium]|nr:histone H1 [Betaproteobacteria bacterium]
MATQPKRPRDANQLAKFIVDLSTGEIAEPDPNTGKDLAAVLRGRSGGLKGGQARAIALSPRKRKQIAKKAANTRWSKK